MSLSKQGRQDKDAEPDQTRTKKSKDSIRAVSRSVPTSKVSTMKTTQEASRHLRQTTLMQLTSKPARRETTTLETYFRNNHDTNVSDDNESDFEKHLEKMTKTVKNSEASKKTLTNRSASSSKGPSEQTAKNYRQLQIHCLKFWGPSGAASRPVTARNKETAKQLSVQEEASTSQQAPPLQKVVQSVLQFEDAPLSEMDVIAEAVRGVVDTFIDSIEDQVIAKEMMTFRSELETVLIEQVDMLDDHTLLRASAKKAAAVKKELRDRLLETQKRRQKTQEELKRVRASFEREERARHRLEDTHNFLTDLETLRDHVVGSDDEEDDDSAENTDDEQGQDNPKTGLQSLIATVSSRCGKPAAPENTPPSILGTLREFNRLLEVTEKGLRNMPLITPSQKLTVLKMDDDDDFDDFDDLDDF
ncbi:hypothetical protein BGZ65_008451 [Modicella reniformis]|uniref:Inner kinetochore subunit AME1 domain-containing protein n=1 Tax=Modicella reniformis TaxID=1440133 RepID=A0A9P6IUG6_9FUNG|nr:hypothetical protein BGZ65_008451 [Modicella reniformis]